jgi:threonine dehydratase
VFTSGGGLSCTARTAMEAANRNGVINVMTELGGDAGYSAPHRTWAVPAVARPWDVARLASPDTQVFAAEPALFDDTHRSLGAGERIANPKGQRTICDTIMTPIPNAVTFPINRDLLASGVVVSDNEVRAAIHFTFEHFKIVTEPGAVVGLAAILNGRVEIADRTVATILTGGNISSTRFARLLEGTDA